VNPFADESRTPAVRGYWHEPAGHGAGVLVVTHGASSNAASPLLVALADSFAAAGYAVLRFDLPYRQARPHGPPSPSTAARDRQGIENAVLSARTRVPGGTVILGGHSYGGRQASMLAAEKPDIADRLLLLSYPLHPPGKHAQLRTAHLPNLRLPVLFVHGTRDPFGSPGEMRQALALIPAPSRLVEVTGAGHDLRPFSWIKDIPGYFAPGS